MLQGVPLRATVRAADVAIALSLTREEFLTLLSDNIELTHGLFKMLLDTRQRAGIGPVVRGQLPAEARRLAADGLQAIERVLLLQSSPLLQHATGDQLLRLAAIAREVPLAEGTILFGESENPAIYAVLSGELTVEAPGAAPMILSEGDTVGLYETLAAVPAGAQVTVTKSGIAMRIDRQALFDLLADDIELLQGIFDALLRVQAQQPVSV
jgi:CRP-like cAMP-binding protein